MASGLPDYYRGVDIAYQALSQMIIRPKYGAAIRTQGMAAVTANAITTIATVAGKGMVYGGLLMLQSAASQRNSAPYIHVDGALLNNLTFFGLQRYGVEGEANYPMKILRYDEVNFIYSVGFLYGITFETSLTITYFEDHGATPVVVSHLVYALI